MNEHVDKRSIEVGDENIKTLKNLWSKVSGANGVELALMEIIPMRNFLKKIQTQNMS
jgi:hypothetical protein